MKYIERFAVAAAVVLVIGTLALGTAQPPRTPEAAARLRPEQIATMPARIQAQLAGRAHGLQVDEQSSLAPGPDSGEVAAAVSEVGAGAKAMKVASERYRMMYDVRFAAHRGMAAMMDASTKYRAMYDRSFVVPGSMLAITASSAEYRAMYDATWAGGHR